MFLSDYHIHSFFSADSEAKISSICERAVSNGISEICITDHIDLVPGGVDGQWSFDIGTQRAEIEKASEKYSSKLAVRSGIEIGQINHNKELALKLCLECKDFIIGSVHNLKGGRYIHLIDYKKLDIDNFFREYLDEAEEIIDINCANCLAHLDYPFRYMSPLIIENFDIKKHSERIEALMKKLVRSGMTLEFNTSKHKTRPEITKIMLEFLKHFKECRGEAVTLGSDSHFAETVGSGIIEASELLKKLGFKYVATYRDKKCVFNKID